MKIKTNYLFLLIIPLFILCWGFFNLYFFDTFYARAIDPEYPYLINGLNVALLEFSRIGHFDHPGTPFQVYCGVIIRITHLFAGKDSIAQDVFNRPDFYLSAISFSLTLLQSVLCFLIAWAGKKREIKIWPIIVLQSGVLLNVLMMWLFNRVIPDRWLVIVSILFVIIYVFYGYKDKHPLKFAIWSGIIMGLGLATKFNYLPVLLLPLFLLDSSRNRRIYIISGMASFGFFLLPIIKKIHYYLGFLASIATHDGIYGQGNERMFNLDRMQESFRQILYVAPELMFVVVAILTALFLAILFRKTKNSNRQILFFAGMFFIVLVQLLMVSKHFKNIYLIPLFTIYPLFLFELDSFIQKIGNQKRWTLLPVILLFIVFTSFTTRQLVNDIAPIKKEMKQREAMRQFVDDKLPSNVFWFVEPTWESAPFVENGIVYGLCYCHKHDQYLPELIRKNPNLITYNYSDEYVNLWRGYNIPIDSVVVTSTPVHIFSSPGRNAGVLMEIMEKAAQRHEITLCVDTLFSHHETGSYIFVMQNRNSVQPWKTDELFSRESRINAMMQSIYNTPEWLKNVEEKAKIKNIPLDSMVLLDAIWMIDNP